MPARGSPFPLILVVADQQLAYSLYSYGGNYSAITTPPLHSSSARLHRTTRAAPLHSHYSTSIGTAYRMHPAPLRTRSLVNRAASSSAGLQHCCCTASRLLATPPLYPGRTTRRTTARNDRDNVPEASRHRALMLTRAPSLHPHHPAGSTAAAPLAAYSPLQCTTRAAPLHSHYSTSIGTAYRMHTRQLEGYMMICSSASIRPHSG